MQELDLGLEMSSEDDVSSMTTGHIVHFPITCMLLQCGDEVLSVQPYKLERRR